VPVDVRIDEKIASVPAYAVSPPPPNQRDVPAFFPSRPPRAFLRPSGRPLTSRSVLQTPPPLLLVPRAEYPGFGNAKHDGDRTVARRSEGGKETRREGNAYCAGNN